MLSGLANMLADAASPSGLVTRRSEDDYELGVTLAATAGGVVFQNELIQLIQYAPTTEKVYKRPLLYIPPLVNKYYLIDLQSKSSLIRWLVEQGHSVFVVSWINPGPELADKGLSDYLMLGPLAALNVVEKITGERSVDLFGFCMGGTLAAIAAGYLAAAGEGDRIGSLTTIGSLIDFSKPGEWATFYEAPQMEAFTRYARAAGVVGADTLQSLFSVVRANDLIWASVVNHYLLDRKAPASDILFWFADGARIPQAFVIEYAGAMLRENRLCRPGGLVVAGTAIDLGKVMAPTSVISLKDDHVSAWQATYDGARLYGGPTSFLLGGSGHNAGLINPPAARKHGYWTNEALPEAAEAWFADAQKRDGSWWPEWRTWLTRQNGGKQVVARIAGTSAFPVLEAAPGSYVRMK
jgi:polyhydroxyalkanoate synthase